MLAAIVRSALRQPAAVGLVAMLLLVLGATALVRGKYDVFPEFVPPQGEVQTEAPGLVSEQVEQLVTQPLEDLLAGAPNVESIRSESIAGLSVIKVNFLDGTDPWRDRQLLGERLAEASGRLPATAGAPTLSPMTSSTMDMLKIGLLSDRATPEALRTFADRVVAPRLQRVPGVAAVHVFGGAVRELRIAVRPAQLAALGLSLDEVRTAAATALSLHGAGFVDTANQRVLLQTSGRSPTPRELGATVLTRRSGPNVRLGDVADISDGVAPPYGDALVMGKPGVLLALLSQYGSNTLDVTRRTEAVLAELRPALETAGITLSPATHRPATFTEIALANMRSSLLLGAVLVLAVLTLFLRDWRTALISFVSIPLSLLAAVVVVQAMGWTINTMTLGGLAVAVGLVVDDAIIDVENIVRRLRHGVAGSSRAEPGAQRAGTAWREAVILAASLEVRRPVVLATFVVGLVFLPILMLGGLQGRFFAPLAAAFLLATFSSLVVALTVTPALCLVLLRDHRPHKSPGWLRRLRLWQSRLLRPLLPRAGLLLVGSLLLGIAAMTMVARFGSQLMPPFREGHFVLPVTLQAGTSLQEMRGIGSAISREVLAIDGVQSISHQMGRASGAEDTWPVNRSEFHVELKPGLSADRQVAIEKTLHGILGGFPGIQFEVLTFLGDRIGESLGGEAAPVSVSLFGPDLDTLDSLASSGAALLHKLGDAGEVVVSGSVPVPTVRIGADPSRLALYGLRSGEVLTDIETATQGSIVGQVYEGSRAVNVRVALAGTAEREPEEVGSLLLHAPDGRTLPLRAVADVDLAGSREVVQHEGNQRRQVISLTPAADDIVGFAARARMALEQGLKLPPGYYLEFAGAAEGARQARLDLLWQSLLAGGLILALLAMAFPDWRSVALILVNVPFAIAGGVLAVAITGSVLSIGSLVGFVTLFGICARNTIMLVSHYEHLVRVEGAHWNGRTALRGARERLAPILMTAVVTALGLLPLVIGGGEAGREVEAPMALVILGGLLSSTLLNLIVVPVLAARWLRPADRQSPD